MRRLVWFAVVPVMALAAPPAAPRQAQAAPVPSYRELKFPPLKPITLPKPEVYTMPNGMRVYLLENHELPLVNGFALVRTGNLFDPPDKHGLADMTGGLIRSGGTHDKTGDELDVELENIAASVESEIGESSGSVSFSCLKENTAEVLAAFRDVLTAPEFRQDKLDLAKTQWRSAIARRNDDAAGIASREFANTLYGKNTPYGWDVNYSDLDHIRRADVQAFYRRYFFPANVMLAVYGDFEPAQMKKQLAGLFSGWTSNQDPVPPFPAVKAGDTTGIYLAEKTDVTQTFFEMGTLAGELRDPDFPALSVAADILGGGFSSRLVKEVRTKLGYAYDISASWNADYDHPGLFRIAGSTQSKDTEATIAAVKAEVEKMRTAEVSETELKTAKDSVMNSFVFFFDRPSKTLNRLLTYEYFGYPRDFIFAYQKGVSAVTRADVLRVAKRYFDPARFTIVAAGNPKNFGTPLAALGLPIHPIDLTIPADQPEAPAAGAEAPAAGAEARRQGAALLAKMQQALGGAERLAGIKDTSFDATVKIETGGPPMSVTQHNAFLAPSILRQDIEAPFGKQSVYSDGTGGWMATPQGSGPLNAAILEQVRGEIFRQIYRLALSDRDKNAVVAATGPHSLRISAPGGMAVEVELDPATGLPSKLSYEGQGMRGPSQVSETLSDWRDVSGIKAPFHLSITQNGKPFADAAVRQYTINSGITKEELDKKP